MRVFLVFMACVVVVSCDKPVAQATCARSADCGTDALGNEDRCIGGLCESCAFNLPAPNKPCVPICGNELGVGQPCSAGGNECSDFFNVQGGAPLCSVDFDSNAPIHICTRLCSVDSDCGSGGLCRRDPATPEVPLGCTPASCVPVAEGGTLIEE